MLEYYLAVGMVLFLLGIYTCLTRVNAIGILMGVELMLNASGLNFVAFSHFHGNQIDGHVMALFVIVLAALEAVVALALLLAIRRKFSTINASELDTLRH